MSETSKKQPIDWERVEIEYRAGVKSVREIGDEAGVSHTAVVKRAKLYKWDRDINAKIQAKADALVSKIEVSKMVTEKRLVTEREIIEASAERIAQVKCEHRADITRMRNLVINLLKECEAQAEDPVAMEEIGELLRSPDDKGFDKLNEAYKKATSLPQRVKCVKDLADTMKILVAMEREAYGIQDEPKKIELQSKSAKLLTDEELAAIIEG